MNKPFCSRALLEKERKGKEFAEKQKHDLELRLQAFESEFEKAKRGDLSIKC